MKKYVLMINNKNILIYFYYKIKDFINTVYNSNKKKWKFIPIDYKYVGQIAPITDRTK